MIATEIRSRHPAFCGESKRVCFKNIFNSPRTVVRNNNKNKTDEGRAQ